LCSSAVSDQDIPPAPHGFVYIGGGLCYPTNDTSGKDSSTETPIIDEDGVVVGLGGVRHQAQSVGIDIDECGRLCRQIAPGAERPPMAPEEGNCYGFQYSPLSQSCTFIVDTVPVTSNGMDFSKCYRFVGGEEPYEYVGSGACRVEVDGKVTVGQFFSLFDVPQTNITAEYCFEYCNRFNREYGAISTITNEPFCTGVEVRTLCEIQVLYPPTIAEPQLCYALKQ